MSAAVDNWRCRYTAQLLKLSCNVENDYEGAQMLYAALAEVQPYPWKKIRGKWRVFQHVPISPTKTARRILGDSP